MNNQHAACLAFALLSAIALGVPGCSDDGDDQDAPGPAVGGTSAGGGGTSAGRGGNTSRAGSGQAGAGGNRCSNVTPVSGQSCRSVEAGLYCQAASGAECICTAQGQQQRGRQQSGDRVWMCYGGVQSPPQGGTGGSPSMPVAGTFSQAGAPVEGGAAGSMTGGADSGGQSAAGAAGSAGESALGGAGGGGGVGGAAGAGDGGSP